METREVETSPRRSATAMRGLRQRRRKAGLKLYAAAAAVGVTRQTWFNWETGATVPSTDLLCTLSRMFDCTVGTLFDGDGPDVDEDFGKEETDDGYAD